MTNINKLRIQLEHCNCQKSLRWTHRSQDNKILWLIEFDVLWYVDTKLLQIPIKRRTNIYSKVSIWKLSLFLETARDALYVRKMRHVLQENTYAGRLVWGHLLLCSLKYEVTNRIWFFINEKIFTYKVDQRNDRWDTKLLSHRIDLRWLHATSREVSESVFRQDGATTHTRKMCIIGLLKLWVGSETMIFAIHNTQDLNCPSFDIQATRR